MTKEQIQKEIAEMNEWIPVSKIEERLGMPPTTLQKVLKGTRGLPKKWESKLDAYFILNKSEVKSAKITKDENNKPIAEIVLEVPKIDNKETQARIKQLEYELAHPPKTFSISGMKQHYFNSRQKELNQLKGM